MRRVTVQALSRCCARLAALTVSSPSEYFAVDAVRQSPCCGLLTSGSTTTQRRFQGTASTGAKKGEPSGEEKPPERFRTDYARSSRSKCKGCGKTIDQGELRLATVVSSDSGDFDMPVWFHVDCFSGILLPKYPNCLKSVAAIEGFQSVKFEDQTRIRGIIAAEDGGSGLKSSPKLDAAEKAQADTLWDLTQVVQKVTTPLLLEMIEANYTKLPEHLSRQTMIDICVDGLAFGAIHPCPQCTGTLRHSTSSGYKCMSHIDSYTRCGFTTTQVNRKKWVVPKECATRYPQIEQVRRSPAERLLIELAAGDKASDGAAGRKKKSNGAKEAAAVTPTPTRKAFKGQTIAVHKDVPKKVQAAIEENGGIACKFDPTLNPDYVVVLKAKKPSDSEMSRFTALVVTEEWVDKCIEAGRRLSIDECAPFVVHNAPEVDQRALERQRKKEERLAKADERAGKPTTLIIKGKCAVDPDSGLVAVGAVHEEGDLVYNATLSKTDLGTNLNSFYNLQLIAHEQGRQFSVFRKWGKVGDKVKYDSSVKHFGDLDRAKALFHEVFQDKTGNDFAAAREDFEMKPGKFMMLHIQYAEADALDVTKAGESSTTCRLPTSTKELISTLFDSKSITKAMAEMDIDTEKMPLGNLSKATLKEGYIALSALQKELKKKGGPSEVAVRSLTNRFYTHVPHSVSGPAADYMINTLEKVGEKTRLLDDLSEMEVTARLLRVSHGLDNQYKSLNTDLDPIAAGHDEYKMVEKYLKNTQGSTHHFNKYDLIHLWKAARQGEGDRFKSWANNKNRKLLWHGSRLTNWVGILSNGLRIAPPEAPSTGYMFGKGVYFADMSSKSANYCFSQGGTHSLMALAEVALGEPTVRHYADYITDLPKGTDSTYAVGRASPDPSSTVVLPDGIRVPLGKQVTNPDYTGGSLQYNEYIVYDVSQIRIRYLLMVQF